MPLQSLKQPKTDTKLALLNARDLMYDSIKAYAKKHKKTTLLLKCNMPGKDKNTWYTNVMLRLAKNHIDQMFKPLYSEYYPSLSGNYVLFTINASAHEVKQLALTIEHETPLGRYMDLDVYDRGKALSREDYNYKARRCYVCEGVAHECARNQRHPIETLTDHIEEAVKNFLTQALTETVTNAMRKEVYLYPKFGLVSNRDSGAHHDMKITHFLSSIDAIKPYIRKFVEAGFSEPLDLQNLRNTGQEAEVAMFKATGNVNTHKGAIFIYGAFLPYFVRGIVQQRSLTESLDAMAQAIEALVRHDFDYLKDKKTLTPGEIIYQKYGLKGVRAEVTKGFPSVMQWYPDDAYNDYQKLCAIMSRLDDTTIIKRHNYTVLRSVKEEMRLLLKEVPFNMKTYTTLSNQYKAKGISPGGAADLLSLVFFLDHARHLLKP